MFDIRELLETYRPFDAAEAISLERLREYLRNNTDIFSRKNFKGHVTGSALTLNKAHTHLLLVRHAQLNMWVQPGGHVEAQDADIFAAASRELREETGITTFKLPKLKIFDIDAHEIPDSTQKQEPRHCHFDIRVLLEATDDRLTLSDESSDIQWVTLEKALTFADASFTRMTKKAQIFLAHRRESSPWAKYFGQ
jgi:8-oxo-dGTP pyrophosphatase MutT (NUDIX family)